MKKLLPLLITTLIIPNSLLAFSAKDCQALASEINSTLPMAIDNITTLKTTVCVPNKKKPLLIYFYDISDNTITENQIHSLWENVKNFWCTDPQQLDLIKLVDVEYTYNDLSGKFLGRNKYSIKDCR